MAENFLDVIANKEFKNAKNGYDANEVDTFLDEILDEMEKREAETAKLQMKIAELNQALKAAKAAPAAAPVAAPVAAPAAKAVNDKHAAESFELVLTKAKGAYEEIVAAADARAEEIISKANLEASSIRADAQNQITDLTEKLASLRKQTGDYYASLKRVMDAQTASMDQIKKLL